MKVRHEICFGISENDLTLVQELELDQVPRLDESVLVTPNNAVRIDSVQWTNGGGVVLRSHVRETPPTYYEALGYAKEKS